MSSSAGTIDADVNITINAEDNATVQVESAAKKINRQWREMRIEQRAVQQSFELSNQKFVATSRVLNQVGSIVGRVQSAYNTYQLAQIRVQDATRNTADATRDLSSAIVEFGLNSPEAIAAAERRTDALDNEKRAANDALISYGLIAATIATLIGRVPGLTGALKGLNKALKGVVKPSTINPLATGLSPTAGLGVGSKTAVGGLAAATGSAAAPIGKTAGKGILGALGKFGPKIAGGAAGFGIGALLGIASDIQPAGGPTVGPGGQIIEAEPLPSGFDAFGPLGEKVVNIITNIFASTPQEIVEEISAGQERASRFTGQ